MNNNWREIWEKHCADGNILQGKDEEKIFMELKRSNGYDVIGGGRYEWWIERGQGVAGFTSEPGSAASNRKPITNPTTEKSNSVRLYGYEPGAVTVRCKVYGEDNGWQDNWTYVSNIKVFSLEKSSVDDTTITNAINDIKDGKNTEIVVPKDQSISKEQLEQLRTNAPEKGTTTVKLTSGTDERIISGAYRRRI